MPSPAELARPALLALLVSLAACAGGEDRPNSPSRIASDDSPRVGAPYEVNGVTYTPADDLTYDRVGTASWYGADHAGRATASGERFDPEAISAAHPTLPLPSYVEVTSLTTGKVILVRINDRGPFARGRIIDLSEGAARLLGIERDGGGRVRVRRLNPSDADKAALRSGRPASERLDAPPQLIAGLNARLDGRTAPPLPPPARPAAPPPAAIATVAVPASTVRAPPSAVPAIGSSYVQIAALSDRGRAERLATALRDIGPVEIVPAGALFRVRLGPSAEQDVARMLAEARRRGYQDARITR